MAVAAEVAAAAAVAAEGAGRNGQTAQTIRLLLLQKEGILSRSMGLDHGEQIS